MRYYRNVFDLGDLKAALTEAFEIKQDRYKYEKLGKRKTCLLIFFNNSWHKWFNDYTIRTPISSK